MAYRYPNVIQSVKQIATDEPDPVSRWARTNFIGAGVDNYAQPPSQDPDMMMQLTNIMPISSGTIQRRWGYTLFSNSFVGDTIPQLYSYQSDVTQRREILVNSSSASFALNEDGSIYNSNIFTTVAPARTVVSRSYAHYASGNLNDRKTWNGNSISTGSAVDNWGIDINNVGGLINGPNPPIVAADAGNSGTTGSQGPLTGTFTTSGSAVFDGTVWTVSAGTAHAIAAQNGNSGSTNTLLSKGYNFSAVPAGASITGIAVTISRSSTHTDEVFDNTVQLLKAGTPVGSNKANQGAGWDTSSPNYGNSTDLWGQAPGFWTSTDIQDANFGVQIIVDGVSEPNNNGNGFHTDNVTISAVSITVYYSTPTTGTWSNVNNIKVEDGAVASSNVTTSQTSALQATGFGFTVADSLAIAGIQVDIKCDSPDGTPSLKPTLLKAGTAFGSTKQTQLSTSSSLGFVTFGGPLDTWGVDWTASDIRNVNFGVQMVAITGSGSATINIDFVRVTIYAKVGRVTSTVTGSGQVNLVQGRVYFVVFQNSLKPITSDLNLPSLISGPATNQTISITGIPVCLDPQCDTVLLLATADGGNEERLYLVATLANGTTTYTDNTPEAVTATTTSPALLNQPVYLSTDVTGAEFGVADNNRPPTNGQFPTAHRGNIYLANATTLFWSKSLADVTTDTNTITSRWEEAWPAANQLDVSGQAEHIAGMISDGVNLYIGTEKKIRRVNGSAPFLEPPDIVHNEVGIVNQNSWQIIFKEGSPIGAMWLTPDNRVIGSDFNTYNDLGTPIQTTLNTINRNFIQTSYASFYSNGPFDLYILAIPTGSNQNPDTLCVYDIRNARWFIWTLTDLTTAMLFNIKADGTPQLIFASTDGNLYFLDSTTFQDRTGNTPVTFDAIMQTSWLDLGDPTLRKVLNEIEITTTSASLVTTVEGASTSNDFISPINVIGTAPLVISPRGEYKVYLAGTPSKSRYYRFTFSTIDIAQFLLGSINVESVPINRQ